MSQTQGTCSYAYSSTCMTTRSQAIVASRRPSTRSDANTLGRDSQSSSNTTATVCKSCTTCSWAKPQRHKPYGLLKQLPVLDLPWNSISMDFIEKLPLSSGYTSILVIVDWLSKQSLFVPTYDTITSSDLAQLFVLHVFSKHGVP